MIKRWGSYQDWGTVVRSQDIGLVLILWVFWLCQSQPGGFFQLRVSGYQITVLHICSLFCRSMTAAVFTGQGVSLAGAKVATLKLALLASPEYIDTWRRLSAADVCTERQAVLVACKSPSGRPQWTKINESEGTSMGLHLLGEPCNQHLFSPSNILSLYSHYDNRHIQYPEPKAQSLPERSDTKWYPNTEKTDKDGEQRELREKSTFKTKFREINPKICFWNSLERSFTSLKTEQNRKCKIPWQV